MQEQLLGWHTEILQGNPISTTEATSPVLNHFNTQKDRQHVIGEKSLHISDQVPFERRITQELSSTPYVSLPDGKYSLSATVKNTTGFEELNLYSQSGTQTFKTSFNTSNPEWTTITIDEVSVVNGNVTVGIYATGAAGAEAWVDDVRFELLD